MINEIFFMNGYGLYVWSAFAFTLLSFASLYLLIKVQYVKERNKFIAKFGTLNSERAAFAKSQTINKEILSKSTIHASMLFPLLIMTAAFALFSLLIFLMKYNTELIKIKNKGLDRL